MLVSNALARGAPGFACCTKLWRRPARASSDRGHEPHYAHCFNDEHAGRTAAEAPADDKIFLEMAVCIYAMMDVQNHIWKQIAVPKVV